MTLPIRRPRSAARPPRIDQIAVATHDEKARQRFVSTLRKRLMVDMTGSMKRRYDAEIAPEFRRRHGRRPRDGREVRHAMLTQPYFQAWSALRYAAQQMTWWSVIPQVERNLDRLVETAQQTAAETGPGSLRLDPALSIPRDVTAMDIHLMPGCFHSEYRPDDVGVGAVYWYGTEVFTAGLKLRHPGGGVARSIAHWLRLRHPELRPRRLLDLGCSAGTQLLPYLDVFPDCEGHGVDVGAPLLRFGHARARALGYNVHFSQQDARRLDYSDGTFDLVVSSFFLHEQSAATIRKVLREAHRVLRRGGLMVHMELPPASEADPYYNFYLDWDAYYNNEPHYAAFRAADPRVLCTAAGFAAERCFATRIANHGTVSDEDFRAIALGERPAPPHGNGASWFIFGALK
jgi:SAM-dependent methyltransferase